MMFAIDDNFDVLLTGEKRTINRLKPNEEYPTPPRSNLYDLPYETFFNKETKSLLRADVFPEDVFQRGEYMNVHLGELADSLYNIVNNENYMKSIPSEKAIQYLDRFDLTVGFIDRSVALDDSVHPKKGKNSEQPYGVNQPFFE